jgi:hypothetical protein
MKKQNKTSISKDKITVIKHYCEECGKKKGFFDSTIITGKTSKWEKEVDKILDKIIGDCEYWDGYVDTNKEEKKLKHLIKSLIKEKEEEVIKKLDRIL